jgi:hypothetical protein
MNNNEIIDMKKIYYIECTTSEFSSVIKGYFETLEEAQEALKSCSNWYAPNNTGKIYSKELGLHGKTELIINKVF